MTLLAYDGLLSSLYDAALRDEPFDRLLSAMRTVFSASSAGFTVYDATDRVTHWLVDAPRDDGLGSAQRSRRIFSEIYGDPSAMLLTRVWLPAPRRFSDLLSPQRLNSAGWYRSQVASSDLRFAILCDLSLGSHEAGGGRIRPFVLRDTRYDDFGKEDMDVFAMVMGHLARAFAGRIDRFAKPPPHGGSVLRLAMHPPDPARSHRPRVVETVLRQAGLTQAEARVAALLHEGMTRLEVATALGISLNTVKTHMRRIYACFGVSRQAPLVGAIERLSRLNDAS